jgi:pyruvate kinase
MRRVKIVCTLGPATAGVARLLELIEAGMDVARLNASHGERDAHRAMVADLREAARRAKKPVAVLFDLCGPKIRVGKLEGGQAVLERGALVRLTPADVLGTAQRIPHTYAPLARDVRPGEPILFDDGLLQAKVERIEGDEVVCTVVDGGVLKDKKGMNLPRSRLSVPALTEKDKADIAFGRELGVDWFALSFVRSPADVAEAKGLAGPVPVMAKIEKPEAVERLEAILDAADGMMVARGDLGVEMGGEKVPLVQKRLVREVKRRAKPVITATQMLDSMIRNPRPTRAEVSDVANAVLDGTDAVMLSGETSVGAYPVEAVRVLGSVIDEIEKSPEWRAELKRVVEVEDDSFSNAVADAVADIARERRLAAIAVYTESGRSAALVSAQRPFSSVVAFSRHEEVLRRLSLYWGVTPLHGEWVTGVGSVVEQAERELCARGMARPGDDIAITFGTVVAGEPFQTNMLRLWKVRGSRP